MPAYNCSDYIRETLESVLAQTYKNWELIIVDDCSTDNTAEIIKEYQERDTRIKYYKLSKNSGAAIARNKAIDVSKGKYMAFLLRTP
jgi:glycosyltransferase involved in cell wall biosynthesis